MPLGKTAGNATVDRGGDQVQVSTGLAANEAVEETIVETSEEGRGEATCGE